MSYGKEKNANQQNNRSYEKGSGKSINEKREIGTQPDTTLTSKPNTTKPNKQKD